MTFVHFKGIFSNHDLFDDGVSDSSCEEAASQSTLVITENDALDHEKLKRKTRIEKVTWLNLF